MYHVGTLHLRRFTEAEMTLLQLIADRLARPRREDGGRSAARGRQRGSEEKGVRLEVSVAGGVPEVSCDRARILQVLSNLIGNAIKFTQPGGSVRLDLESEAGAAVFTVEDTGPGIVASDLPRGFERYWRADNGRGDLPG